MGLGLCLAACEGAEVAIFSLPAQAGAAGISGVPNTSGASGTSAGTAGASAGGSGGSNENVAGMPMGNGVPVPCQTPADCDSTSFCSKQTCADAQGVCLPVPFPDETVSAHVCGCEDKITYWNDSFRQYYGISASTMGVCNQERRTCVHNQDCHSRDAVCAHLLPPNVACGTPPGLGQCWIIPNGCPTSDPQRFLICPPPGSGQPAFCASTCQAIQSGHPFMEAPPGQTCL